MKVKKNEYNRLELITAPPHNTRIIRFASKLFQTLFNIFESALKVNEPKIYASSEKSGNVYWKIYDPLLGRSKVFFSESEVCEWLDRLYYQ